MGKTLMNFENVVYFATGKRNPKKDDIRTFLWRNYDRLETMYGLIIDIGSNERRADNCVPPTPYPNWRPELNEIEYKEAFEEYARERMEYVLACRVYARELVDETVALFPSLEGHKDYLWSLAERLDVDYALEDITLGRYLGDLLKRNSCEWLGYSLIENQNKENENEKV